MLGFDALNSGHVGRPATALAAGLLVAALLPGSAAHADKPVAHKDAQGFVPYVAGIATRSLTATGVDGTTATRIIAEQQTKVAVADRLTRQLGSRAAGAYLDRRTGDVVVNVLDNADAAMVRGSGATTKVVPNTLHSLNAAIDQLNRTVRVPNTAWQIDVASNQVVVTVTDAVAATDRARVETAVKSLGALARVETSAGALAPKIAGGEEIVADQGWICSAGFNAVQGGQNVIITAGHCTHGFPNWRSGNVTLGPSLNSDFPGDDFGLLRNTGSPAWAGVALYNGTIQLINTARDAFVGENVCKSGRTSHITCGTVTGLNSTVNYAEGTVYGLIQTTVYAAPGDSGGSLFDGGAGLGMTSGGNSTTNWFQPLPEALGRYGVTLYGGSGRPIYGNGKCVDVRAANPADATPVQIYDCNGTSAQQWTRVGNTFQAYGKCMDISGNGTANNTPIILYSCHGGGNQQWVSGANNSIYNPQSNRCLDLPRADNTNSNQLAIYDCNATVAQQWNF